MPGSLLRGRARKSPVVEMDPAEWGRKGSSPSIWEARFYAPGRSLPGMIQRKYGKIINISSVAARPGGFAGGASLRLF